MEQQMNNSAQTPQPLIGKLGGLIIFSLFIVIAYLLGANNASPTNADPSAFPKEYLPNKNDSVRGDADIYLIEYSDFECPFCKRFHPSAETLVNRGDVAWVYRHFPLSSHKTAKIGAVISECVREFAGTEAYWSFVDSIFASDQALNQVVYLSLAEKLGVSKSQLEVCVTDGSNAQETVKEHIKQVSSLGITGTPTSFLVNKKTGKTVKINGAQPLESVERLLLQVE